ncbi:MAG: GNAT family N-acetyltransferase [Casimicrobiaceae bacterium]
MRTRSTYLSPNSEEPTPLVLRNDVPLSAIVTAAWDRLAVGQPLLSHAFLSALEATGCAAPQTGWAPCHVTAWRGDALVGALPLYAKSHSYGEYVFDWGWADAYRRHGRRYYPKLLGAIPFTPAPGPRLLGEDRIARAALLQHALGMVHEEVGGYASLHILFLPEAEATACADAGMLIRMGVQFHWENPGYASFDDFLAAFNHDKRKKVRQDRRKLAAAGVVFTRQVGRDIGSEDWDFFFRCYQHTYRVHGSTAYLSRAFFGEIQATMPDNLLLVQGWRDGHRLCAALDVFDANALWGRYWGATQYVPGLHFEACYYQAIEFCVEHGLKRFEGGAQGVHKLARGLLPVTTYSVHAIADPAFRQAIADFCARERRQVDRTVEELESSSPFRDDSPLSLPD